MQNEQTQHETAANEGPKAESPEARAYKSMPHISEIEGVAEKAAKYYFEKDVRDWDDLALLASGDGKAVREFIRCRAAGKGDYDRKQMGLCSCFPYVQEFCGFFQRLLWVTSYVGKDEREVLRYEDSAELFENEADPDWIANQVNVNTDFVNAVLNEVPEPWRHHPLLKNRC